MAKFLIIVLRFSFFSLCAIAVGPAISGQGVPAANSSEARKPRAPSMTYPLLIERLRAAGAAVEPDVGMNENGTP